MVTPTGRPSVVRRQLGRRMRTLRVEAGKTIEDVVLTGVASRTKIWRIEGGKTHVKMGDVLALTRLYGADNAMVDELLRLADATRDTGYVEDFKGVVRESLGLYAELEASAAVVTDYQSEIVPGLLQAADYIPAVVQSVPALPPNVINQRIAFRLQRQRAFFSRRQPGRIDAILTAGALTVQVGSASVMDAQREHLRALANRDGVSIRVLPFENGLHSAQYGPFTMLDFDDPDDPSLVYVENLIGGRYIERADHIAQFRAAFEQVRAQAVPIREYLR